MRLTRILCLTKSVRDEIIEMQKNRQKSKSISEFLVWLYKERNFSIIDGLKHFNENKARQTIEDVNKFFESDLSKLGPDLHAASYTLKLGGKCRLHGSPRWISLEGKNLEDVLPTEKIQNFNVEGLDFSKTVIKADGISNVEKCSNLRTLILNNCLYTDDWLLSRISHAFCETLEKLEISNCPNVTDNGLITLGFLKNLKSLKLENLTGAENKEFISILLEDNQEGLTVQGVNHLSEEVLKSVEQKLTQQDQELNKIIKQQDKTKD